MKYTVLFSTLLCINTGFTAERDRQPLLSSTNLTINNDGNTDTPNPLLSLYNNATVTNNLKPIEVATGNKNPLSESISSDNFCNTFGPLGVLIGTPLLFAGIYSCIHNSASPCELSSTMGILFGGCMSIIGLIKTIWLLRDCCPKNRNNFC